MKFLRYHISIILPLFLLLFVIESFYMLKKIIDNYESKISSDYAIVLVSKVPVDKKILERNIKNIAELKLININNTLDRLKNSISKENLKKLKTSMPLFYSLKLKVLPSKEELLKDKQYIQKLPGIRSVSIFQKRYGRFYNFLIFNRMLLMFFTVFVSIIVLLLIVKQAEVWIFEHKQRFEIMSILGAPFWMKSAMLYRVVIVDSIVSSLAVTSLFYYIVNDPKCIAYFKNIGIVLPGFNLIEDGAVLFGIGILVSIFSVTFAIIKLNKE